MNAALLPRALLVTLFALAFPTASFAHWDVGVTVGFAPPELPVYVQPPCPASGYIWTPGYWAYAADDQDYYWVPGAWVMAPSPGLLWTPGYWAYGDDAYLWHAGYWAPHVGFYGGVNYGFGYFGEGFHGGYWHGRDFYYNRAVTNIRNVNVTHVYNSTVSNDYHGRHASYNGGNGVHARPSRSELIAAREPHRGFTSPQRFQAESAHRTPGSFSAVNHGHPEVAAAAHPRILNAGSGESRAAHQPSPAPAWRQPAAPRAVPRSAPPARMANNRAFEPHAPAAAPQAGSYRSAPAPRPNVYRPAPARPAPAAASAYRAPSAPVPRAPPSMPRGENNSMRPHPMNAPAPRPEMGPRGAPPARVMQAPRDERRHS